MTGVQTCALPIYDELLADSLFWDGNWALWGLVNLNPRMYWHGNCNLKLKSIEIEDQLFHNIKTQTGEVICLDSNVAASMRSQISNDFPSPSNGF